MRQILNINKGWAFLKDWKEAPVVIPEAAEIVDVPHCWNATDGQDGGNDNEIAWRLILPSSFDFLLK